MIPSIIERAFEYGCLWLELKKEPSLIYRPFEQRRYFYSGYADCANRAVHINSDQPGVRGLWAVFHELVHIAQVDRGDHMFVNYACLLQDAYWDVYFGSSWQIEREARAKGDEMFERFCREEGIAQ